MSVAMYEWQNRTTPDHGIRIEIAEEVTRAWYVGKVATIDRLQSDFFLGGSHYWLFCVDGETTCNQQNRRVRS